MWAENRPVAQASADPCGAEERGTEDDDVAAERRRIERAFLEKQQFHFSPKGLHSNPSEAPKLGGNKPRSSRGRKL